jgi:hypothetical protein
MPQLSPVATTDTAGRASQACRSRSPSTSGGCAPEAPIARSTTKNGTALMPSDVAVRSSARTSSAYRSVASTAHEPLLHGVLRAVRVGEMEESMRVEGRPVAREVEAEVEPFAGGDVRHLLLHRTGLLDARAVLRGEVLGAVAGTLARGARIEFEAAPRDLDLVAVLEGGERGLEPALPDEAPGAGDIGPDLYVHRGSFASGND